MVRDIVEKTLLPPLIATYGSALRSVMVYGSAAGGHYVRGLSDINLLVIVEGTTVGQLAHLGRRARRVLRKHRAVPLVMTREEFRSSADVFPMEYMDIRDRNIAVHGEDEARDLVFSTTHLRHQLEDGLRGALTYLRQAAVASRGRRTVMAALLRRESGRHAALMRGLLRLRGVTEIPDDRRTAAALVAERFAMDPAPLLAVLDVRDGRKVDSLVAAEGLARALGDLVRAVDSPGS